MNRISLKWPIGSGGMGTVWEAERVFANGETQPVACKVLHEWIAADSSEREMFYREAMVNLKIARDHTGIVLTYDCATDKRGRLCIVMERVEGCSLHALTQEYGKLPDDIVQLIIRRALEPIAYMHDCEIVHRDISPSNILIRTDGQVKITDFGLCIPLHRGRARVRVACGKIPYISPEVLACKTFDARADLYSTGAMLWELLCGQAPFGADDVDLVSGRMDFWIPVPLPDDAPRALRKLALGWVCRDPDDRWPISAADGYDQLYMRTRRERAAESMLSEMVSYVYENERAQQEQAFDRGEADGKQLGEFIEALSILNGMSVDRPSDDRTRSEGPEVCDTVPIVKRSNGAMHASGPSGDRTEHAADERDDASADAELASAEPAAAEPTAAELAAPDDRPIELPEVIPPNAPDAFPFDDIDKYPLAELPADEPEHPDDPEVDEPTNPALSLQPLDDEPENPDGPEENEPTDPALSLKPPDKPDPMRWQREQRAQRARARRTRRVVLAACVLGFLALRFVPGSDDAPPSHERAQGLEQSEPGTSPTAQPVTEQPAASVTVAQHQVTAPTAATSPPLILDHRSAVPGQTDEANALTTMRPPAVQSVSLQRVSALPPHLANCTGTIIWAKPENKVEFINPNALLHLAKCKQ